MSATLTLAPAAHAESSYAHIPFSVENAEALARKAMQPETPQAVFQALMGTELVGLAGVSAREKVTGTDLRIAVIHTQNFLKLKRSISRRLQFNWRLVL